MGEGGTGLIISAFAKAPAGFGLRPFAKATADFARIASGNRDACYAVPNMSSRPLDAQIDRLYQLPLDEFTAARNALAKESGAAAAEIRALQKPPIAAWAINQVYWRGRAAFHGLTAAAAALRDAHTAVVTGKPADLRAAGKAHEDALEAVVKLAVAILRDAGQPATDATRQAIATTLRALPASTDPPGRLTTLLQPTGFELLAGLPAGLAPGSARASTKVAPEKAPKDSPPPRGKDAAREKAVAKAKEAVAAALRAERSAEQHARREEFEAARTAREADRAASDLAKAQAALEAAQEAVEKAEREAETATRKKDAAARRMRETAESLAAAKIRTEAAQAALTRT